MLAFQDMVGAARQRPQARSLPVPVPQPQKSLTRPFCSQSPKRVGSGPFGPPISLGLAGGALAGGGAGVAGVSGVALSVMTKESSISNLIARGEKGNASCPAIPAP